MPDKFIKNTGPDPLYPKPAVLNFKGEIDITLLKRKDIKYLVFPIPEDSKSNATQFPKWVYYSVNILNTSNDLRKINQIGEWGIYAVQ